MQDIQARHSKTASGYTQDAIDMEHQQATQWNHQLSGYEVERSGSEWRNSNVNDDLDTQITRLTEDLREGERILRSQSSLGVRASQPRPPAQFSRRPSHLHLEDPSFPSSWNIPSFQQIPVSRTSTPATPVARIFAPSTTPQPHPEPQVYSTFIAGQSSTMAAQPDHPPYHPHEPENQYQPLPQTGYFTSAQPLPPASIYTQSSSTSGAQYPYHGGHSPHGHHPPQNPPTTASYYTQPTSPGAYAHQPTSPGGYGHPAQFLPSQPHTYPPSSSPPSGGPQSPPAYASSSSSQNLNANPDDKRVRNTAASARFRAKKKQREASLERKSREKRDVLGRLEGRVQELETENRFLKGLVFMPKGEKLELTLGGGADDEGDEVEEEPGADDGEKLEVVDKKGKGREKDRGRRESKRK